MLERGYDCRSEAATWGPMSAVAVLHSSHSRLTATGREASLSRSGQLERLAVSDRDTLGLLIGQKSISH